eukprot:m.206357 g.206357  ORF g.206357 m.206357 type:complete len:300 (-) comp18898_c0_seq3:113-1012(-)
MPQNNTERMRARKKPYISIAERAARKQCHRDSGTGKPADAVTQSDSAVEIGNYQHRQQNKLRRQNLRDKRREQQIAKRALKQHQEESEIAHAKETVMVCSTTPTWPADNLCKFIFRSVWDKNIGADVLRSHGVSDCCISPDVNVTHTSNFCNWEQHRTRTVIIRRITDKAHPAYGECGLFTTEPIRSHTHILDYSGFVTSEQRCSKTSDYILQLTDGLSVDAEHIGNEARFINDFRGIGRRPNVELKLFRAGDTNPRQKQVTTTRMEVWSGGILIPAGAELLLSYGKGWWRARKSPKRE